jgi:hypothetical protein
MQPLLFLAQESFRLRFVPAFVHAVGVVMDPQEQSPKPVRWCAVALAAPRGEVVPFGPTWLVPSVNFLKVLAVLMPARAGGSRHPLLWQPR